MTDCEHLFHLERQKKIDARIDGRPTRIIMRANYCIDCTVMIPCGPANDTPVALVELRAAELSNVAASHCTTVEGFGWFGYGLDRDPEYFAGSTAQWSAGWLGRCINEHNKERP